MKKERIQTCTQNYLDLVFVQPIQAFNNQKLFKIDRFFGDAIRSEFQNIFELRTWLGIVEKKKLVLVAFEFMGSCARQILNSITTESKSQVVSESFEWLQVDIFAEVIDEPK